MKKLTLFLVFSLGIFILSCNKNTSADQVPVPKNYSQETNSTFRSEGTDSFEEISVVNGMLHFQSMEHFKSVKSTLEVQLEQHLAEFDNLCAESSDEEIEQIEEEMGFDDWEPLVDFENQFPNFRSRRKYIEDKILLWLDHEELDMNNDPDDLDTYDEEFRTLLTTEGNVSIGSEVINFLDQEEELAGLFPDCRFFAKSKKCIEYNDKKNRMKVKVAFSSWPWRTIAKSKVINLRKKKRWGKWRWRRSRTIMFAQVGGHVHDIHCQNPQIMGGVNGPKKRKILRAKWEFWGLPMHRVIMGNRVFGYGWVTDNQIDLKVFLTGKSQGCK